MHTRTGTPPIGDAILIDASPAFPGARLGPRPGEGTEPSTGASVMLDIGEGSGALVIYTSENLCGEEIEIRPHDGLWVGLHTAVRARHLADTVRYAGVFGSLPAGFYDLRVRHCHVSQIAITSAVQTVMVPSGAVAETTLLQTHGTA